MISELGLGGGPDGPVDGLLRAFGEWIALFGVTRGWEDNVVEALWMVKHGRGYYLFYSGGRYTIGS